MTVIRIDPAQLDETAALLDAGAGEYEAIGAALAYADLGAMPTNVAGAVGAAYADVRSILADLSNQLGGEAQTLRFRSNTAFEDGGLANQLGVIQAGLGLGGGDPYGYAAFGLAGLLGGLVHCCCSGTIVGNWDDEEPLVEDVGQASDDVWSTDSAVSAAWGPGVSDDAYTTVIGGGFDTSVFGDSGGGYTTIVGGNFELPTSNVGGYTTVVGGNFDTSIFGDTGSGYSTIVGGNFELPVSDGGGYTTVVGGNFELPTYSDGGGYTTIVGGNFTLPDTGNPTDGLLALSQLIDNQNQSINAQLSALMSNGGVIGDPSDPVSTMLSMDAFKHMMTSMSRMQTTMSPLFNPDMSDPNYESQFGSYAYEY